MAVRLQAGELNTQVAFERLGAPVSDNAGGWTTPWAPFFRRWASVKAAPMGAGAAESIVQGRLTGTAVFSIVVRYDYQTATLTTDDRAIHENGKIFNIRSAVDLDGDRRFITITAESGVAT